MAGRRRLLGNGESALKITPKKVTDEIRPTGTHPLLERVKQTSALSVRHLRPLR
jgi:hypothetical protein